MKKPMKIKNPKTGKWIMKGGKTHKNLLNYYMSIHKSIPKSIPKSVPKSIPLHKKNFGWSAEAPLRRLQRKILLDRCGEECFLYPQSLKFPICSYTNMSCRKDCRGIRSAKIRALQWKDKNPLYGNIANLASELEKKLCL